MVSLIIPTYNRAATIGAAVESALSQTYRPIEIIVVDDGSSDNTVEGLRRFGDAIKVISQDNAGPSAARNRGVLESKGEIIAFLDSDDFWLPEKIDRQIAVLEKGSDRMCCCVCNALVKGVSGEVVGTSFDIAGLELSLTEGEWINPGEVLATRFLLFNQVVAVRRDAFVKVGGFNPRLRILEDFELAMKLAAVGSWGVISDPLVIKRNDTDGIGVACMNDRLAHAETCYEVIAGILEGGVDLDDRALWQLRKSVSELRMELMAERGIAGGSSLKRLGGHFGSTLVRFRRAIRRRSPSWPKVLMKPL